MRIPDPSFSARDGLNMALELLASRSRDSVYDSLVCIGAVLPIGSCENHYQTTPSGRVTAAA